MSALPPVSVSRPVLANGPLLCSLAMALVGSTVVVSQLIAVDLAPFLATALRHALALPVFLWLLARQPGREPLRWPGWHDALLLLLQAGAGSAGYTVLLMLGVQRCGAADAGIVAGALPAVAGLFAWLFLGERPGPRLLAALVLATAGVMTVAVAPGGASAAPNRVAGIALVLAAIACEAVFILASRRLRQPLPPLQLSTLMSAGGLLLSLAPAAWGEVAQPSHFSGLALAGVAYYAWLPTVGGFLLWYAGSARTSGIRAALATAWLPVSALLLSALVFRQPVLLHQWAGLACVLVAVGLAAGR